ncbi:hypothetical protein [Mycolicibacterium sp. XJ1819]
MRISSTVRKWFAALALVAMVVSGIGIGAVMIFGSITSPEPTQTARPAPTFAQPTPKVPIPVEFTIGVAVTDTQCAPEGTCAYKYTIEPQYVGRHPLPETPFTVFYEVNGGFQPQKGEFTVHKDQAKILKDVVVEGPPNAQLRAIVMDVKG